jgi:hypothetical protein
VKEIPLTRGLVALVDDEDFELVSQYKWYAQKNTGSRTFYAKSCTLRKRTGQSLSMHRLILAAPDGLLVDHINGNGLDNRGSNLRLATNAQNAQNCAGRFGSVSKFKGVAFHRRHKCWIAKIAHQARAYHLGYFNSEVEAARAYDQKARELFGEFARLNFPNESIAPQGRREIKPTSVYKGIAWVSTRGIWTARLNAHGRRIYIGSFVDETEAALAYDKKAREVLGDAARLNFA